MNIREPSAEPDGFAGSFASSREQRAQTRATSAPPLGIAVFGLFGVGNHGNEGSLEVMLDMLRRERPDADLLCVCADPPRVASDYGVKATAILPSRKLAGPARLLHRLLFRIPGKVYDLASAFRTMRRYDVMIIPGTGILDDFCERPAGMPLSIFIWCLAARAAGARICMVSIGAGPIRHPLSRRFMVWAAQLANFRSYRDQISKEFMEKVGVDTWRDHVQPDLVFKMLTPDLRASNAARSGPLSIGVGVMGYRGWYGFGQDGAAIFSAYIEKMVRFVGHLLQSGYDVRLLVGDEGDDRTAVETILNCVRGRPTNGATIVAEPISSLHDLMAQIAQTDLVVATRFHNVLGSLKLGKPTISLGYARKNDVLMAQMGLEEYCDHVEQFEVGTLIRQLSSLIAHRSEVQARIDAQCRAFRDQLERQDRHLLSDYLSP